MTDGWKKRKYDPKICEAIKADIEANCHDTIGDKIQQAKESGDEWRALRLQNMAQTAFDMMVRSNGEITSHYADIRQAFEQFTALEGYQPYDRKTELEKRFDVTECPKTGEYLIHPKGILGL